MSALRLVQFQTPQEFLQAEAHDDAFLNLPIGSLLESMDEAQVKARKLKGITRTLLAVYHSDALVLVMVKVAEDFTWELCAPREVAVELGETEKAAAMSLLVTHLAATIDPTTFDNLRAPDDLVDLFLDRWIAEMQTRGLRFERRPDPFVVKVSYATLATIPPAPPMLQQYELEQPTAADAAVLAGHLFDFARDGPRPLTRAAARDKMQMHVAQGDVWVCRAGGEIAAFCVTGRWTPRTVAVRNVYVVPPYRGRGLAEALIRMITRYLLGATPLGFAGDLAARPPKSVKAEVALNVAEDFVERIYKRCGFLLGENDRDPVSGKKGWFTSVYCGVRLVENDTV